MMRAYPAPPHPNHCVCEQREEGKTSRMTASGGGTVQRMLRRADDVQRAHPTMAFPFAVFKKFGDDRASQLAALIAYPVLIEPLSGLSGQRRAHPPGLRPEADAAPPPRGHPAENHEG